MREGPKVSVYVPVRDEADRLEAALQSVRWADEVVVIDTGGNPEVRSVAERYTDRIVSHTFQGFGRLRQAGVEACTHAWVLSIDADERCTPELAREIRETLRNPSADAYWIPRKNWFMGRWIRHCGWWPDYAQPKLFLKKALMYADDPVHEGWSIEGRVGFLHQPVVHFSFRDPGDVLRKIEAYSRLGSAKLLERKRPVSVLSAVLRGLWAFIRIYILKLGFLDGAAGFVIAISNFQGTFYRYLWATWTKKQWDRPPPSDVGES